MGTLNVNLKKLIRKQNRSELGVIFFKLS